MADPSERTIPVLPCSSVDEMVPFYEALGFVVTYRQVRPNPYLCVKRGGLDLHFFGVAGLVPEDSLGSALVLVPDTAALFADFAAGLKLQFGRLPLTGIPRITRPRRKQGMAGGFTVVDPGGNWLRVTVDSRDDDNADEPQDPLERVLLNAARQGDSHGDIRRAIHVLEAGLLRHSEASALERIPLLAYLAELQLRFGEREAARRTAAAALALPLTVAERASVKNELLQIGELVQDHLGQDQPGPDHLGQDPG